MEREEANGAEAGRREITGERRPPQWLDPTVYDLKQVVNAVDDYKDNGWIGKFLGGMAEHLEYRVGQK